MSDDQKDLERFEESQNYMDKLQDQGELDKDSPDKVVQNEPTNQELKDDEVKEENVDEAKPKAKEAKKDEAKFDRSAVELDIPFEEIDKEPEQAEDPYVVYIPQKDFGARVNQQEFKFIKGVRTRVTRDLANMLLEDESRGYVLGE